MRRQPRGTSGTIERDGLRLHHLEYGAGEGRPSLLVIPGITSPAITWEFVAEALEDEFHVIVVDLRGRGDSDVSDGGYAMADYAADMEAVIAGIGLDRPVVLGHSLGARIAAVLGASSSQLAGPLILVDPPMTGPGRAEYPTPVESFREQLRDAREGTTAEGVLRFFPRWDHDAAQLRAEWLATCDEEAVVASWHAFHDEDLIPSWRRLRAPLLFVYGEDSPVITPEDLAEIRAENPAAEVVGIADAGHMIPWENLDDFLGAVRAFAIAHAAGA